MNVWFTKIGSWIVCAAAVFHLSVLFVIKDINFIKGYLAYPINAFFMSSCLVIQVLWFKKVREKKIIVLFFALEMLVYSVFSTIVYIVIVHHRDGVWKFTEPDYVKEVLMEYGLQLLIYLALILMMYLVFVKDKNKSAGTLDEEFLNK